MNIGRVCEAWEGLLPRIPTRVLINDALFHDESGIGEPVITTHLAGATFRPQNVRNPAFPLDEVELSLEAGWLGRASNSTSSSEISRYQELIANILHRAGWDINHFRLLILRFSN